MRSPTPQDELYRWHRESLARLGRGEAKPLPVDADEPQCGWFKMRAVKGGPWIPVRIACEQVIDPETGELAGPELMRAEVGIERRPASAYAIWPRCCGRPISEAEWESLIYTGDLATMEATHAPVDLTRTPMRPLRRRT